VPVGEDTAGLDLDWLAWWPPRTGLAGVASLLGLRMPCGIGRNNSVCGDASRTPAGASPFIALMPESSSIRRLDLRSVIGATV